MPALILIIPLLVAGWDQAPRHLKAMPHVLQSYSLPPHTDVIYFVAY